MAETYASSLVETFRGLFGREGLDLLIAYAASTVPLRPRPMAFSCPEALDRLIFNGFCVQNLSVYLRRYPGRRIGILVKGCDSRAIQILIQENQLVREELFLIGIPCPGMLNRNRLLEMFPGLTTDQVEEVGESLTIQTPEGSQTLPRAEVLLPSCRNCHHRVPNGVDLLLDSPPFAAPPAKKDFIAEVGPIGEMQRDQRAALFAEELSRCILCYACRNVCPLCYCETCFTDTHPPAWMTSTPEPPNIFFYHVNRMMHMAGRCVACGSCEWACPEQIQLHLLYGKITADVAELFSYEAGLDATLPQPLSHFSEDDPDEHIG